MQLKCKDVFNKMQLNLFVKVDKLKFKILKKGKAILNFY